MQAITKISNLSKIYNSDFKALHQVNLDINKGEILALLGPNGAGKTTLISIICGLVKMTKGEVLVNGFDIRKHYRQTRSQIGLVPQELTLGLFDIVWDTVSFSRNLYGKKADDAYISQLLKDLSIYDKKDEQIRTLSGGMKRRVLIAKALSHQPQILFLDEPTAGVDVELRKDMWQLITRLKQFGVTIILTTHYIEEAEFIADRIGVINAGKLILVEEKNQLMKKLGKHQLNVELEKPLDAIPLDLSEHELELSENKRHITYSYNIKEQKPNFASILQALARHNIAIKDLQTSKSSLEDIFIDLVKEST